MRIVFPILLTLFGVMTSALWVNSPAGPRPVTMAKLDSACGPPAYCARKDLAEAKYPAQPPALGPAGSIIKDPDFNTRILRVTDANTLPGHPGFSFHTNASSEENTWSKDSRRFVIGGTGGQALIFDFDPSTMTARYSGVNLGAPPTSIGGGPFSYSNPDIIYGWRRANHPEFAQYDFSSKKVSVLHDPAKCVQMTSPSYGLDISVSADDERLMGVFGPGQDRDQYVYIYDRKQGCRWYNTFTGEVGGQWGPKGTISLDERFKVHNARISLSGKYAAIAGAGNGLVMWNVDTLNASACLRAKPYWCGGHWVMGYSHLINVPGVRDPMNIFIRPLDNLLAHSPLLESYPQPTYWKLEKHLSWNNDNPDDTAPVCLSTYRDDNPASPGVPLAIGRAWENEVLCISTQNKKNTVWRFAHTYTTARNGFWSSPRGNVSQDGRFYMFTSDWEDTLGRDRNGKYRTDVFVVELK